MPSPPLCRLSLLLLTLVATSLLSIAEAQGPGGGSSSSSSNYFDRLRDSFYDALLGILLVSISIPLLWLNEGKHIKMQRLFEFGQKAVIPVEDAKCQSQNQGKLVHVTGQADTTTEVRDPDLGINAGRQLRLRREVAMYQWVEHTTTSTKENWGGTKETVTKYSYSSEWKDYPVDSSNFHTPQFPSNPPAWPVTSGSWDAVPVTLGEFALSGQILSMLTNWQNRPVTERDVAALPEAMRHVVQVHDSCLYIPANSEKIDLHAETTPTVGDHHRDRDPDHNSDQLSSLTLRRMDQQPQIGDVRVRYELIPVGPVSLIARQTHAGFVGYRVAKNKGEDDGEAAGLLNGTVKALSTSRWDDEFESH